MITLKKILLWGFFNSCSCRCRALELLWQHSGPAAVPEPSGSNREDCEGTNLLAALGSSEWIWVLKTVKMTVVFRVSIRPAWFFVLAFSEEDCYRQNSGESFFWSVDWTTVLKRPVSIYFMVERRCSFTYVCALFWAFNFVLFVFSVVYWVKGTWLC